MSISSCKSPVLDLRKIVAYDGKDVKPSGLTAKITKKTKSFSYVGEICELDKGLEFTFLDLSDDDPDFSRFKLAQPIKGCGVKKFISIPSDSIELIDNPFGDAKDVDYDYLRDDYDFDSGNWSKLPNVSKISPPITESTKLVRHYFFPFLTKVSDSYVSEGRQFGAFRSWGRRHAAADLLGSTGQTVRAVADGTIIDYYPFYAGTYAMEVDHKYFLIRYGEVFKVNKTSGAVKSGEHIAKIAELNYYGGMLHFELYTGLMSGPLTQRSNKPYQRRNDLVNPTTFLQKLESLTAN
ncbi:MAG: M23 family metallopeptidase [Proteobacteria bacterium]|nr:M23 family metallopeptidase [Pseudomonadota bacterium]